MIGSYNFLVLYFAIISAILVHELAKFPGRIEWRWKFPIPLIYSVDCPRRYSGLILNMVVAFSIAYFKPQTLFLQLFGAANWIYFIVYSTFGNFEESQTKWLLWLMAVLTFIRLQEYYISVLGGLFIL